MKISLLKKRSSNILKVLIVLFAGLFIINSSNAQTHVSGGIYSNTTWTTAGSPYIISDTVTVISGVTLTIQPGVVVEFDTSALLDNRGTLNANGTVTDSIIFTSSSVTPYAGIWNAVEYGTSFSYCRFSYSSWGISVASSPVSHCTFTSNIYGIYSLAYDVDTCTFMYDSTGIRLGASVVGCRFIQNGVGDNASTKLLNCYFNKNTTYGSFFMNGTIAYCTFDSNACGIYDPYDTVRNCSIRYNTTGIVEFGGYIVSNSITNNNVGIQMRGTVYMVTSNNISNNYTGIESDGDQFSCNTICSNTHYNVILEGSLNAIAKGNDWCLNDSAHIQATIYDVYQNSSLGFVYFTPFDTVPCANTPCSNSFDEPICIVTIDTANNKSEVIWGRTNTPPAGGFGSFVIYKYDTNTTLWNAIHTQALDSLSQYIDPSSNPSVSTQSYELATIDSCGESLLSAPHTSIFLTTTSGINVYNLSWTAYVGFTPTQYRIFRGPALNAMVQIDSVASSMLTFTDSFPPLGSYYAVEAVSPHGVCVPTTHRYNSSSTLSGSFSNGFNTKILGVQNLGVAVSKLNVYPNPSNGVLNLNYSLNATGTVKTTIINELGQIVYDNAAQKNSGNYIEQINLGNLAPGIYSLRMQTDNNITTRKIALMGAQK